MVIWILTVRSHRCHPNRRLLDAAGLLHQEAFLIHPGRLYLGVTGRQLKTECLDRHPPPEVVLPRLGSTIKEYGLTAIRQLQQMGIRVLNGFDSLLLASNKFLSIQTLAAKGIPVVETFYASNRRNFKGGLDALGGFPMVVKTPNSRQGSGVFLFASLGQARPALEEHLGQGRGLLMQRYIPTEGRKDYRVLVVGEEVVGAMSLTPRKGEFRANVHLGGKAVGFDPGPDLARLALRATKGLGLDIAGVDVIQDGNGTLRVMEVNSSPGFRGLEGCTGKDIAAAILRCAIN
jgi:ribosomal protein S6--L-glutamate ligase